MTSIERRRYERVPFSARLTVVDLASGHRFKANAIDISVVGMAFYAEKLFGNNSRIRIHIRLKDAGQEQPVEVGATVRRARLEQDGAIMGAEFDAPLSPSHQPMLYERLSAG